MLFDAHESNRIIYRSDCLDILENSERLPNDSVDLIYLDPPFNSNAVYNLPFHLKGSPDVEAVTAFTDTWTWGNEENDLYRRLESSPNSDELLIARIVSLALDMFGHGGRNNLAAYLLNMGVRLRPMRRILKPTGSIYLHCDPIASHYLKILMDALYGRERFRNEIVWAYRTGGAGKNQFARKHDVLLFYTKSPNTGSKSNQHIFNVLKERSYLTSSRPGFSTIQDQIHKDKDDRLYTLANMRDVWNINAIGRSSRERLSYPTQKPLALMETILKASTNPGDLVLDPFCGCGTTLHAAEALGRRWIGIDISRFSAGLVRDRLMYNFEGLLESEDISVVGVPTTMTEAESLAKSDPFEFEKWVCGFLGVSKMAQRKLPGARGPDRGIDGQLEFAPIYWGDRGPRSKKGGALAIIQVKSGRVSADAVRALYQVVRDTPKAEAGVMVCFGKYMSTVENNRSKEVFEDSTGKWPVIQGLSIERMLKMGRFDFLPNIRKARGRMESISIPQPVLPGEDGP